MFVNTDKEGEGAQELGDRASSPRSRREGDDEAAEARGCGSVVLELLGEKQGILQGFLAPWEKAFEEWRSFAPSLYLELKS